VVVFFEEMELLFQAVGLYPARHANQMDSNQAIRLAQRFFDHDIHIWFTVELKEPARQLMPAWARDFFPFHGLY
jgi:hypothetical protein